jgi:hypothetical protein
MSIILPGVRQQNLNITIEDGKVVFQMAVPCKEMTMDPESAVHLARQLAMAAQECYNKFHRADDYSLENDADVAKILGKKQ